MGTKYQGTKKEIRALNAYIKLVRATESVTARINRHLAQAGLSVSQFDVLEAIHHLGPLCQRDIARKIRKSTGNITIVIDSLEKRGLVTRVRSDEDRRYFTINLTDEGEEYIKRFFPVYLAAIMDEMAILDDADQEKLGQLCRTIGMQEGGIG